MNRVSRIILSLMLALAMLASLTACAGQDGKPDGTAADGSLKGKIVTSGSTSMEDIMTALGEGFTAANPGVQVEIQGGGSSTGVKNASDGISDIGNASRSLKDEEKSLGLTEHVIAIDGIAVVVNSANAVTGLTSTQVADIFTGKITNWQEVGGADAPIVVILREAGSGTRDGFESILKIADQCVGSQEVNETGIVKSTVAGNVNAIGYLSLGKASETVHALAIDGVAPSEATVKDGSYTLQRPFTCLTKGEESSLVKAFFEFIFSPDGQAMVAQKGYVPVK
ncbi:MAG TPA: phosphate ABC transporter phosphate-binding protein [Clostridiales bacterium]|nr:phosphate ABC transporter phosphate-binding protein [Clostridiales bacterium]